MKYKRPEIESLCQRLEARSASLMFPDQPNLKADLRAAALILRLVMSVSEIEAVETSECQ